MPHRRRTWKQQNIHRWAFQRTPGRASWSRYAINQWLEVCARVYAKRKNHWKPPRIGNRSPSYQQKRNRSKSMLSGGISSRYSRAGNRDWSDHTELWRRTMLLSWRLCNCRINFTSRSKHCCWNKNNGSYIVSFIPSEAGQHLLTVQVNGENIREFPPIEIKERSFVTLRFIAKGSIQNSETLTEISPLSKSVVALAPPNNLSRPWGVASNDSNEIFVSDMDNNRIVIFNEKGEFIGSFGQNLLNKPTGLSIDNKGRVYVANRGNNKILLFNAKGD